MDTGKHSCEAECAIISLNAEPKFIVITGGPGAGKTALLEFVRKLYCVHVAILPEAAGILFNGGFWRLDSVEAKNSAQRAIFHVQKEMENLVVNEKKWLLGLCDRGSLDGLAYWNGSEADFFKNIESTKAAEISRYYGVIHLRSPDLENGYNYQNPLRKESVEVAREIDLRIENIWSSHPRYISVGITSDFLTKVSLAEQALQIMMKPLMMGHQILKQREH